MSLTSELFDENQIFALSVATEITGQPQIKCKDATETDVKYKIFSKFTEEENMNFLKGLIFYGNKWQLVPH